MLTMQMTPPKARSMPPGMRYSIWPRTISEKMDPQNMMSLRLAAV